MARCSWKNYPDGTTGCCLTADHDGWHDPHPLWELTPRPREIVRRTDGRLVACVRELRDEPPEGMSDADRGQ